MSPRTQAERTAATRTAIIEAARALFADRGFADTRIDDIVAAAGVAKGGVFHHFADKRAILDAVTVAVADTVLASVERAADAAADPITAIEAGCMAFVDAALDPGTRRILLVDAPAVLGWERWRVIDGERSMRSLEAGLRAIAAADGEPSDVAAVTHFISGGLNELVFWLASQDDPVEARQVVASIVRDVVTRLGA